MRKRIIPSSLIIVLLLLLFSSGAALAGSNTRAGITIDFNSTDSGDDGENTVTGIGPDQVLRIDVYAHDVVALKCFEFDMVIDTGNVDYLSVAPTGAINFDPNILEGAATWVGQKSGNIVAVAYANDTTPDGANGDGLLAEINVRTKSSFTTSTQALFTIISVVFVDTGGVNDHILNLNTYHIDGAINPTDTTPPDPVIDLVATPSGTDSTITLTWTNPAPGDAVTCLFKYSANPILNEADWEDAILLINADFQGGVTPVPSAGTATVIGLPEGDYHFAMKTMDSTPNVSGLSTTGYTVTGTVGLADNPPDSSGSEVCIGSFCDSTDSHGAYSISNVFGGTYDIIATHSGYYPDTVSMTISSDTTVNFTLTGVPSISVNPDSLVFGEVYVDSSKSLALSISNVGRGILVVTDISSDNPVFTTDFSGPDSIGPGGTSVINATFTPDSAQAEFGTLTILNNDHPVTVPLTGRGITEPVPEIGISPTSLSFGDVVVGDSLQDTFTIYSEGTATLEVTDIQPPTAYSVNVTSATLPPGDSVVVTVTFKPPDILTYDGQIHILSNDPDSPDTTVDVSGRGVIYDVGVEVISCPDTLRRNEPDTIYVDLINFGNVTAEEIHITAWLVPDSAANETTFTISSLPAGQTLHMTLELLFDDTASYQYNAHLCADLAADSNPENDCDSCSFYYDEVPIRRMGVQLPRGYYLSQNYPNPFNPLTQIEYSIPHRGWVRLEVYNIVGEKVATLVDRLQEPGFYRIGWDAGYLKSGVYFCRMEAGDFTFTRRMVLLK